MEDYSGLFLQWAMDTLQQQEHPPAAAPAGDDCGEAATTFPSLQALREASQAEEMVQELIGGQPHAANSWSSGDSYATDGSSSVVGNIAGPALSRGSSSAATQQPTSWNFSAMSGTAATARSLPEMTYGTPPTRRPAALALKSMGSMYAQDHIIAERKRREKINQRFVELSTVIPGLKKMDKATILSDATRHVKELQEKLKALEGGDRSIESWVLVKKPCIAVPDEESSPSSGATPAMSRNPLPEIEARFLEKLVMVRIHCEGGKGVAVKVLAELDELHLSIVHANVIPFPASTLIITITAKVEEGFTVTADEIVGRLNSALLRSSRCCNSPEETGN
ncbi:unnamed protein product [Urochloa decumbens]|uniref:BHLH domain-containing protein n=1 Tax=Urochloa decumbens TaxID=240449 RepID=A0ABC9C990_9POAL